MRNLISKTFLALLILAVLSSCQTTPNKQGVERQTPASATRTDRSLDELSAAERALDSGANAKARRLLNRIDTASLRGEELFRYRLATLRYYVASGRINQAERAVGESQFEFLRAVPLSSQIEFFHIYARILEGRGDALTALRMLILADERLTATASKENHQEIFRLLEGLSPEQLLQEARLAPDLYMRGWYDFALLSYLDPDFARFDPRRLWALTYERHPGNRYMELLESWRTDSVIATPTALRGTSIQVAFILPFNSEGLGPIAEAVVEGYISMAQRYRINVREIRLDTSDNPSMEQLYRGAIASGSDIVIGPLRKEKVDELYQSISRPPIPIIALNELPSLRSKDNFYSYRFSFEDNVDFTASIAWDHQCRNMAILAQDDSNLAVRGVRDFQTSWQILGGSVERMEFLTSEKKLPEWISDVMDVTNAEVGANKEVFRTYLLRIARMGVPQGDVDALLDGETIRGETPKVYPHEDRQLLLSPKEVADVADVYYNQKPIWELSNLTNQMENRLDTLYKNPSRRDRSSYTRDELESLLEEFFTAADSSFDRADIDCIFMAMDSIKASQVRPFLSFYLSNDIPVFGTFVLYDRDLGTASYSDLEGVIYGELAGMLVNSYSPKDNRVFTKRFYLMGRDLFLISRSLPRFEAIRDSRPSRRRLGPSYYVLGEGGLLHMKGSQIAIIPREAQFHRGLPRSVERRSVFQ